MKMSDKEKNIEKQGTEKQGEKKETKVKLTATEKMAQLGEKIEKMKKQKQAIANREKEKERKQRTRRLIENGAIAEKYLQRENSTPQEFEKLLKALAEIPQVKTLIQSK
jgi:hypothetical protein